jgi:predicted PurR-regulated permease PerM
MSANLETRLFGTVEPRLFRVTAVLFALIALAALIGSVVWVVALALSFFYNLILPLSVAGILALVLYPVVDHLEKRMRLPRVVATSIVLLLVMVMIGGRYSCSYRRCSVRSAISPRSHRAS